MDTLFVQMPSSIRINVFWLISLILSLTTVLVGTIALQWLREHQSYPGLSPKESLAILHMRSESLKAWYVPQIFSALPLLLQGALVLFLAGLIDFTLPLGTKLTAPIACVIGLVLLFLAATTALPAFQALFFLSGHFSPDTISTPCAFKSPQSQVFRTLFGLLLHLLSFVFPKIYLSEKGLQANAYQNILSCDRHLFPSIYVIWHKKTWPSFDSQWLVLRDAWHNGILDKDANLYEHRQGWGRAFPLSDITRCLVNTAIQPTSAKHTEEFLVAACYCFQEISASVLNPTSPFYAGRVDRRNNYFEQIHQEPWYPTSCSFSKFLIHGGRYKYDRFSDDIGPVYDYVIEHYALFYRDQTCLFLELLQRQHSGTSPKLERYGLEIKGRMMQYHLTRNIKPLTPTPNINDFNFSHVFDISFTEDDNRFTNPFDSVDLLTTIFENVRASPSSKQIQWINPLYAHKSITITLNILACDIIFYLQSVAKPGDQDIIDLSTPSRQYLHHVGEEYSSTFNSMAKHLDDEISSSDMVTPSLLFDLSAIFLQNLLALLVDRVLTIPSGKDISFGQGLASLLDTVFRYKKRMIDRTGPAETRFKEYMWTSVWEEGIKRTQYMERFSDE